MTKNYISDVNPSGISDPEKNRVSYMMWSVEHVCGVRFLIAYSLPLTTSHLNSAIGNYKLCQAYVFAGVFY